MAITFDEKNKVFHLYNDEVSYVINVLRNGFLGNAYYGKRIDIEGNIERLIETGKRAMACCYYPDDRDFSIEHLKQEYPVYGAGDFRYPALDVTQENGSRILELYYDSYKIIKGKPKLENLPATYVDNEDDAQTLIITLKDHVLNMDVELSYTIFNDYPVITRSAKIINNGEQDLMINQAMSMSVDFPDMDYEMIELTGAWSRERHVKTRKLEHGVQSIYSMRGTSSNNFNPFIALKREETTEFSGEVYGFNFVYSGNFLAQVDVDTYNTSRVSMGINPNTFNWNLVPNKSFQTPEVVMVYSDQGLNYMSQSFHKLYNNCLVRGKYKNKPRPILLNNWEGTYMDFDEEKLLSIAKDAKELGVELFVLDDGWFGIRNDDNSGLGDWFVNREKLPSGIDGLSEKIQQLGLDFGLWIEPEMVNKESQLYKKHPEWTLLTPNRNDSHGRGQYILDFSNDEVINYIFNMLDEVIKDANISYIKWDMNRCMSEVYSTVHDAIDQGKVMHEYILGVYKLYEMLINKYPDILFESCASGGARFDPGMLYYAPQAWASDDTDAVERQKIQYGTSFCYPLSSIGAHISASPNHQLLRETSLETRANVAYFGTFGYELDPNKLSAEEKSIIKEQIKFMKEHRELLQFGTFYRLRSPFESKECIWMVVSKDCKKAIVGYYRTLQEVNVGYRRVRLQGLDVNLKYSINDSNELIYGNELMNLGLITTDGSSTENNTEGDYISKLFLIEAK